ncbi:FAD-dependent oxidoreductase [Eggerthellaceae bacterium zg-997]|nr:FAD-dependent oxidoreductase [Eggerthellaceae bacterium zg-997]
MRVWRDAIVRTGGTVTLLSIAPNSREDGKMESFLKDFERRVETTPPGMCPIHMQLALVESSAAQTCGKCVPCRDGLPKLASMLERIADCRSSQDELDEARALAEVIRDMSDCAIGWHTAALFLEGLDRFADEYRSHVEKGSCTPQIEQKVPCEALCPAHVDVPGYIALVAEGDCAGAVNMVRKDNPFPTACALVCEHPCEIRCRRRIIDAPINIRGIKKYAVDNARCDTVPTPPQNVPTGRRIAVIGGGPGGMTCAYFAALMGHEVTVFEARKQLGGMMRYGIPAYRFPRERLDEDIRGILAVKGIHVECGRPVDEAEMRRIAKEFDAVYVAIGAQVGKSLALPGIEAEGVSSAVSMLEVIGDGDYPDYTGKRVVVIGGGNVAMDCARTAVRCGADEVSVVYRRRREDMTALEAEIEAAACEGVELMMLEAPVSIEVDERGRCAALVTQPQMISHVRGGRPAPVNASRPQNRIAAEVILVAVGQDIVTAPFEDFGMPAQRGRLVAGDDLAVEGLPGVFVGGDCHTGPATIIKAIGAGKVAARNIDHYLGYTHTLDPGVTAPEARPNDRRATGRVNIPERPARERKRDFDGVELEISHEEVLQECGRCLRCDHFGCGTQKGGRIQYV